MWLKSPGKSILNDVLTTTILIVLAYCMQLSTDIRVSTIVHMCACVSTIGICVFKVHTCMTHTHVLCCVHG